MYIFHLFQSFLPLRNPLGFGASDYLELALALILVALTMARGAGERWMRELTAKRSASLATLFALPIGLRLLLLRGNPVPTASGSDDFSYLLLGDTLRHFRLANPAHALSQFFETIFVLQTPTYSSIFPVGQGIVLALGQILTGTAWAGVLLLTGLFSISCYWMLHAWTKPTWALIGGLLAVFEFGPLSYWTNSYWGGALSAIAGCLVFGALPRLQNEGRRRDAALMGVGLGVEILTRPFEALLLSACVLLFFVPSFLRKTGTQSGVRVRRGFGIALLGISPALALTLAQNKAVTGSWTTMPYMLSRWEYGVPTSFTFQPVPVAHHVLTPQQALDYRAQSAIHSDGSDSFATFMSRWFYRLRYYRFFFLPPLYLAALVFGVKAREWRFLWAVLALGIFSFGTNIYPYFYPHYVAAISCLCILVSVKGLEWLAGLRIRNLQVGLTASQFILFACATQFLFWYGIHLFNSNDLAPVLRYDTADFINSGDPEGRMAVNQTLAEASGSQLVIVRYGSQHRFREWVHNAARIDASRVVWANDLGATENEKLLRYYPDRRVWLLEPDAKPPRLIPYLSSSATSHQ